MAIIAAKKSGLNLNKIFYKDESKRFNLKSFKALGGAYAVEKVTKENNLLKKSPNIAKEWHPTKNGELLPEQFVPGTHKKVWWLCPQKHSYEAGIQHRTKKIPTGCPHCSNQSSEPEIRILSELKWFFDEVRDDTNNANNRFLVADKINSLFSGIGPFWGCPANLKLPNLPAKGTECREHNLPQFRICCLLYTSPSPRD